ncbi:MAG: hypothetical protein PVH88_23805 [Ignavibacteria bacterium]|jgi:hypothetical protein
MAKISFDRYTIIARIFPAIISSTPILLLLFELSLDENYKNFIAYITNINFYGYVSVSLVFLYFFAQLIRYTSKFFENIYFHSKDGYPTTYLLLYKNKKLSHKYKSKLREKIKKDFDFILMTESEENINFDEAKKELSDITQQILAKNRNNSFVQKHNVWYGFSRNLLGGIPFTILFSIVNILIAVIYYEDFPFMIINVFSAVISSVILMFNKVILIQNAEKFAIKLFAEYMEKNYT